jgi:DNA-directed RNA polymerase subunit RPC12/RpoP
MTDLKTTLYCPHCGDKLEMPGEELFCEKGSCYFSRSLTKNFLEAADNCHDKSDKTNLLQKNGNFFCIHCGVKLSKLDKTVEKCELCGFEIDKPMYFQLAELNPHRRPE